MKKEGLIERLTNAFERIYPLVRPQAHNRIAWFVVLAGTTICAGPFWEPYARAAFKVYFNIDVPEPPGFWLGTFLIVIGLIYHLAFARVQLRLIAATYSKHMEHDAITYKNFKAILKDEELASFLDLIERDHSYNTSHSVMMDNAIWLLKSPSGKFLIAELKTSAEALLEALWALNNFMGHRFFVYPNKQPPGDTRYCLQPSHNVDRDWNGDMSRIKQYDIWAAELKELVEAAYDAYRKFTDCAHKHLGKSAIVE